MTTEDTGKKGGWVAYRPELKLLDCSIRDGGLINDSNFDDHIVKAVYDTCVAAGVDYMEIGYKTSKRICSRSKFGAWKFCDEDDVRRIVGENDTKLKLSCMADAERTDYKEDILPRDQSVFDLVRVAAYIHQIPTALDMMKDAHDKGYETCLQLMAISGVNEHDLKDALELAAGSSASMVYIVDSFGSLYGEQVRDLTKFFLEIVGDSGKGVGFHGHNNQQLAFANSIESIIAGAAQVDGTMSGIGRGAGNCPLELLVGFLHNPKFDLRPILKCCRDVFHPLSSELQWGYSIPYALTGQLNQHPRTAIAMRAGDAPDDYVAFYDQLIEEE